MLKIYTIILSISIISFTDAWAFNIPNIHATHPTQNDLIKYNADVKKIEHESTSKFTIKTVLNWKYGEKNGKLLLVESKEKTANSCLIYLITNEVPRALGGNKYCRWVSSPKLVWQDDSAWIEFPAIIKQPKNLPITTNEITVHFDVKKHDICILGLPVDSYDDISCFDGLAQKSR